MRFRRGWEDAEGWEYEALRRLPPDEAVQVWRRAYWSYYRDSLGTWRFWAFTLSMGIPVWATMLGVWKAAAAFGWGPAGRVIAEVVVHATLFGLLYPIHKPVFAYCLLEPMKPYIEDELRALLHNAATSGHLSDD